MPVNFQPWLLPGGVQSSRNVFTCFGQSKQPTLNYLFFFFFFKGDCGPQTAVVMSFQFTISPLKTEMFEGNELFKQEFYWPIFEQLKSGPFSRKTIHLSLSVKFL